MKDGVGSKSNTISHITAVLTAFQHRSPDIYVFCGEFQWLGRKLTSLNGHPSFVSIRRIPISAVRVGSYLQDRARRKA
jgi:hypothetical protein